MSYEKAAVFSYRLTSSDRKKLHRAAVVVSSRWHTLSAADFARLAAMFCAEAVLRDALREAPQPSIALRVRSTAHGVAWERLTSLVRQTTPALYDTLRDVADLAFHDEEVAIEPGEVSVSSCGGCGEAAYREDGRWRCEHKPTPRGPCVVGTAEEVLRNGRF